MTRSEPNKFSAGVARWFSVVAALAVLLVPAVARAAITGETGTSFSLTARAGYISIADGGSVYSWGYSTGSQMQLPGPTLIVTAGQTVTVTLANNLPAAAGNVSIVFPGHQVTAMPNTGVPGLLTQEAQPGGTVTYTFTAGEPGTYQYHSGTRPDLQVEMGLYGALVVRPSVAAAGCADAAHTAYNHAATCFDREYLYLLSEVDLEVHRAAEQQASGPGPIDVGDGPFHPEYWLLNGRAAPDTMAAAGDPLLPTQPYNAMTRMHPGERLLLRVVGAGRDMHPFHTHGNHVRVLARDGRLLLSATDATKLAGPLLFTIPSVPGGTVDAIFEWTGKDLGWDIYGTTALNPHTCIPDASGYHSVAADPNYREWCADHNRPIPVNLPDLSVLAFGGFYSGSPYLGALGSLPPGEGGLNPDAGYAYMWHSHTEREMVNNDVFPGGMMTMLIIEAPGVLIVE
ncbi:MAG: multicopper oxidase domain-containing protein [Thiobacillus sp.]|jgi:FtsP/CotA-like multicopper oxidase with cupredoxin domain|nr:multicopper oxidase domain-containing protein [Thiobacillus sp.]